MNSFKQKMSECQAEWKTWNRVAFQSNFVQVFYVLFCFYWNFGKIKKIERLKDNYNRHEIQNTVISENQSTRTNQILDWRPVDEIANLTGTDRVRSMFSDHVAHSVRDFSPRPPRPPPVVVLIWDQDSVTAVRDDSLASNIFRVLLKDY